MKKVVLKYGIISGLLASFLLFITMLIEKRNGFGSNQEILELLGIILAFGPLYMGVRSYRETIGGGVNFLKALNVGILIIVISAIFYAVTWSIIYYWITPDFTDKYSAYLIQQIKASGKNLKDTVAAQQQMAQYKEMAKNPLKLGGATFEAPLPLGLILAVITAIILRRKPPITEAIVVEEESKPQE